MSDKAEETVDLIAFLLRPRHIIADHFGHIVAHLTRLVPALLLKHVCAHLSGLVPAFLLRNIDTDFPGFVPAFLLGYVNALHAGNVNTDLPGLVPAALIGNLQNNTHDGIPEKSQDEYWPEISWSLS